MNARPHVKQLAKLIQGNGYRHGAHDVFRDFVELAACAVANTVDITQAAAREARYLQVIGRYDKDDQQRFPQMFATLVQAMEEGPADVLGEVFGLLELGNAAAGQFFTPYSLCRVMAQMTVGDGESMRAEIQRKGFITVAEPAVGAGAQVIALAESMRQAGLEPQHHLHVTATDVDPRAVHMAYLQLALLHVPAIVIRGNTLTLEEHEHWRTPAHVMGLWDSKLRRGYALGSGLDTTAAPEAPVLQPGAQIQLFDALQEAA